MMKRIILWWRKRRFESLLRQGNSNKLVKAAHMLGAEAISLLIGALRHEDASIRQVAVETLGSIGGLRAVEPIIVALNDNSPCVRKSAVEAMEKIGDTRVVEPLVICLADDIVEVRKKSEETLETIDPDWNTSLEAQAAGPRLIERLDSDDSSVLHSVVRSLSSIRDARAVDPLIRLLEHRNGNKSVREAAEQALETIGAYTFEPLIHRLVSDDEKIRRWAASALGGNEDVLAVDPLTERLTDEHQSVRYEAAIALGGIGDARAIPP